MCSGDIEFQSQGGLLVWGLWGNAARLTVASFAPSSKNSLKLALLRENKPRQECSKTAMNLLTMLLTGAKEEMHFVYAVIR